MCFASEKLPVLIQTVCFCSSGKGAPTLFKSSEPQTISFPEPSLTASERLNPFCKSNVRTNLSSQGLYNCLQPPMHARAKCITRTDSSDMHWHENGPGSSKSPHTGKLQGRTTVKLCACICMYLLVLCQDLHVSAGIMSVYACMCSHYETITPKMSLSMKCRYVHVCACICWYLVSICMYLLISCQYLHASAP